MEIFEKTEQMLLDYLQYLIQCKWYDLPDTSGIFHPEVVGYIDPIYVEDEKKTRSWVNNLPDLGSVPITRWEGGVRDLYGTFIEVQFNFPNCRSYTYIAEQNIFTPKGDRPWPAK